MKPESGILIFLSCTLARSSNILQNTDECRDRIWLWLIIATPSTRTRRTSPLLMYASEALGRSISLFIMLTVHQTQEPVNQQPGLEEALS